MGYQREVREARQLVPDQEAQTKRTCPQLLELSEPERKLEARLH